jgi:hypothetical protein
MSEMPNRLIMRGLRQAAIALTLVALAGHLAATTAGAQTPASTLTLAEVAGPSGSVATVPLSLTNTSVVKALQFDVAYDADEVAYEGVTATGRGAGLAVTGAVIGTGLARIVALYDDATELEVGSGEVAQLGFRLLGVGGSGSVLAINDAVLSDPQAQELPVEAGDGRLDITVAEGVPGLQLALLPNPARPRSLQIHLVVTNGSGQLPAVTAGGAVVAMAPQGGGVFLGTHHVDDGVPSVAVVAYDTNANGMGTNQASLAF